jgi:hypothetical protein
MNSLVRKTEPHRMTPHPAHTTFRSANPTPVAPGLNTVLAVREHAPAEIEELETEIQHLHEKLGVAYARKRLLEQMLSVIREADAERPVLQSGMAVVK